MNHFRLHSLSFISLLLYHLLFPTPLFLSNNIPPLEWDVLEDFFTNELNESAMLEYGLSGIAVSVVSRHSSEPLYFGGFGFEDPIKRTPVTNQTVFGFASISKTFVAVSALQTLSSDGEIQLDVPLVELVPTLYDGMSNLKHDLSVVIGDYVSKNGLPEEKVNPPGITLRNLVTHTAGFDENIFLFHNPYKDDLHEDINHDMPPLIRQPGIVSCYSNYGVALVGLCVQVANQDKVTYGEYIRKHLFRSLGMGSDVPGYHIHYGWVEALSDAHLAGRYSRDPKTGKYWKADDSFQGMSASPSGDIYGSSASIQVWARALLGRDSRLHLDDSLWDTLFRRQFSIGSLPGIDFVLYEFPRWGQEWMGHHGDITPFHGLLALNLVDGIGLTVLLSGRRSAIRDVLLDHFAQRFFTENDGKQWCESYEGGVVEKRECIRKFDLETTFPRDQQDHAALARLEGCYMSGRRTHANFLKMFVMYLHLVLSSQTICLNVEEDGYLHRSFYADGEMSSDMLVLERKFIDSNASEVDYVLGVIEEDGNISVSWTRGFKGQLASVDDTSDHRYIIVDRIIGTFEYVAHPSWWVFTILFAPVWSLVVLLASFVFLIIFINVSVCMCCCCKCCNNPDGSVEDQFPLLGSRNRRNRGWPSINSGEDKDAPFEKKQKCCLFWYAATAILSLSCLVLAGFFDVLHFWLLETAFSHSYEEMDYPRKLISFDLALPIVSVVSVCVSIILFIVFLVFGFGSLRLWRTTSHKVGSWCQMGGMFIFVVLGVVGNILYWVVAADFNAFAYYDQLKF